MEAWQGMLKFSAEPWKNPKRDDHAMDENKEEQEECKRPQKDPEGNINLCCCYI
jgi:hypothetical protein